MKQSLSIDNIEELITPLISFQKLFQKNNKWETLIKQIKKFNDNCYFEEEEKIQNEEINQKFKRLETFYDQWCETEKRYDAIVEYEKLIKDWFDTISNHLEKVFDEFKTKLKIIKEHNKNLLNRIELIDDGFK